MEWKVYASRRDYTDDDAGTRGKHASTERGELWEQAPGGIWAFRDGDPEPKPVYVRKRPGKGKPFYYRIQGEETPRAVRKPKPKPKPANMEPLALEF